MGRYLVILIVALSALSIPARGIAQQGTSQIAGKVTDAQGAVLPGVSVVVKNEDTGASRELTRRRKDLILSLRRGRWQWV